DPRSSSAVSRPPVAPCPPPTKHTPSPPPPPDQPPQKTPGPPAITAPAAIATRAEGKHLIENPEGPIRRQIARSVDDLVTRMPTHEEAVELQLPPGVPVVRVPRAVFDSDDLPVEVQDSVVAADRHEFRYEEQMR